jgi:hypothetical protein
MDFLASFDFKIQYQLAIGNVVVDALSRQVSFAAICLVQSDLLEQLVGQWVNAWYSGPIFRSQCFFSIPHCIATSIKNTLDISSTF